MNLKSGFYFLVIVTVIMICSGVAMGADVGNNPSETGICPQNCTCLTNESANWKYLLPLQCSEDICGHSPDGSPMYCFNEMIRLSPDPLSKEPCSSGCTCLARDEVPWVEVFNADGTITHKSIYEKCSDIPCAGEYENPKFCYRVPGAITYACDHSVTVYSGLKGERDAPMEGVPITIYGAADYGIGYDVINIIGSGITDTDGELDVPIPTSALENWTYFYVNVGELPEGYSYAGSHAYGEVDLDLIGTVFYRDQICHGDSEFWISDSPVCSHGMTAVELEEGSTYTMFPNEPRLSGVNMQIFGSNDTSSYNVGDVIDTCVTGESGICYLFIPDSALDRWDYFFTLGSGPRGYTAQDSWAAGMIEHSASVILIEKGNVCNGGSRFLFAADTSPTTITPTTASPPTTSAALNIGIILSALAGAILLITCRRSS